MTHHRPIIPVSGTLHPGCAAASSGKASPHPLPRRGSLGWLLTQHCCFHQLLYPRCWSHPRSHPLLGRGKGGGFLIWVFLLTLTALWLSPSVAVAQVYCSSSTGNDACDGLTEQTAVRTIRRAAELGHDIRLKGGDTFYERIALTGTADDPYHISAYGTGMPRISGFKVVPKGKGLWKRGRFDDRLRWVPDRQGDIFRLDLWDKRIQGLGDTDSRACDIGCLYAPATDEIHGIRCGFRSPADTIPAHLRGRQFAQCLADDYDFYQPWTSVPNGSDEVLDMPDDRYLYVKRAAGNLNREELWLSCGLTGVNARYLTIDGLHILGWGVHGVGTGTHTNVLNCKIDIIGGSLFQGYSTGTRYGNGIEFYIGATASDCLCEGNEISRTFDCGITIQGAGFPGATARHIVFRRNVIRDCRQSMEFWLSNAEPDAPDCLLHFDGCVAEDNLCYPTRSFYGREHDGNNSQLLFYQARPVAGLTIRGNTFIGGDTYHFNSGVPCASLVDNTFICTPGQYLDSKRLRLSDHPGQEVEELRRITGERSLHVIVKQTLDDPLSRDGILWESRPLPSAYDSLMAVRSAQVEALLPQQGDAFLFWTDTHTDANALITPYVMHELLRRVPGATDKVVWGGDAMPAFAAEVKSHWSVQERMNGVVQTFARNYNVRGNHDFTVRFSPDQPEGRTLSQAKAAGWLRASTSADVVRNPADTTGCYYYFDEADARIRYIVLETNDTSGAPDQAWGVAATVGDRQLQWVFDHVVPATPQDWGLVFISHMPVLNDMTPGGQDYVRLRERIGQIGSRRPDLRVLMVLSGHEHYDYASYEEGILHVVTSCNAHYGDFRCSPLHAGEAPGEWNTPREQSFDYVSVDSDWTTVSLLRFGPCASRTFSLEPLRLKVGDTVALPDGDACRRLVHDARGNVCEPLPGYQCRWLWHRTVADITPDGKLYALAPGEAVLITILPDGTEAYRAVEVE